MRPTIHHLVYVSAAITPFTKRQLIDLLQQARDKNRRLGVTGLLVYRRGWFMQVLEGEKSAVRDLFATIAEDDRHRGVTVMAEGDYPKRQFPDWSMGFRDLDDPQVRAMDGFSEFMNNPRARRRSLDPKGCLLLLGMFAASGGSQDAAPAADTATRAERLGASRRTPTSTPVSGVEPTPRPRVKLRARPTKRRPR